MYVKRSNSFKNQWINFSQACRNTVKSVKVGGLWSEKAFSCVCMFSGPLCNVGGMVVGDEAWGIGVSSLLPVWMETQIQALSWSSPSHTQPPLPRTPPVPGTTHPDPPALHCPPPCLCFLPWPLIAFMPLFSQCEKFDNVHKRNSRVAAGYGKSTCGSSLPPLWKRLGICSFIDLFWADKDAAIKT